MSDYDRINKGDFVFGIGIILSELLTDSKIMKDDESIYMYVKNTDDDEVYYSKGIEELQTICKNEGFCFVAARHFIPLDNKNGEFRTLDNDNFILISNIDYKNENEDYYNSIKYLTKKLAKILKYFNLDDKVERFNYYLYFSEKVIINEKGKRLFTIVVEDEWTHNERLKYGD